MDHRLEPMAHLSIEPILVPVERVACQYTVPMQELNEAVNFSCITQLPAG